MADEPRLWRSYEEVAAYLLNQMASEFGLEEVVADQTVLGLRSGTEWKIEAKGIPDEGGTFVIIECRRYQNRRLNQEAIGGLAYRIIDTGALGGIVVTPVGLQEGAARVAAAESITTVILDANSSSTDYILKFLDKIKVGISGEFWASGRLGICLKRKDGTVDGLG